MFFKDSKPMGSGAADHSDKADKFGFVIFFGPKLEPTEIGSTPQHCLSPYYSSIHFTFFRNVRQQRPFMLG